MYGRKVGKSYYPPVPLVSDVLCALVSLCPATSSWILGLRTVTFLLCPVWAHWPPSSLGLSLVLHIPLSSGCNTWMISCLADAFFIVQPWYVSTLWLLLQHPPQVGWFGDAIGNLLDPSEGLKAKGELVPPFTKLCHSTPLCVCVCVCVCVLGTLSEGLFPELHLLKHFFWPSPSTV